MMNAKPVTLTLLCLVVLVGCQSTGPRFGAASAPAAKPARTVSVKSQVGRPVQEVITNTKGLRMQFFTLDDKALDRLPAKAAGSVSIHAADGMGQDNYRFDEKGRIDRHLRSYGADYGAGVWKPAP